MACKVFGFATSANYGDLTAGDLLVAAELQQRGYNVEPLVWSEAPPESVTCDAVVLRSVWDYHLDAERFLDWVTSVGQQTVIFNNPENVRWNADKRYLFDLQSAGLPIPNTMLIEVGSEVDVVDALLQRHSSKAVIKPAISASAYETHLVDMDNASAKQTKITELLRSRSILIQDFVPEIKTRGEWSLMFFGGQYSHAVRKVPELDDFRVQSEFGGSYTAENPPGPVLELGQQAIARFAADALYARIDLVEASYRPLIMELELIDPELFFATAPNSAVQFAEKLLKMCGYAQVL
jgi:glutathione synthase/RimK-type ligase-like ATP-grasp enzyme